MPLVISVPADESTTNPALTTAVAGRFAFAKNTKSKLQHHLTACAQRLDSIAAAKSAALRFSEMSHNLADPLKEILNEIQNQDAQTVHDTTGLDRCSGKDVALLRKQLQVMLCAVDKQIADAAVNDEKDESDKDTTNSSLVSEEQGALLRFSPAAARAMHATNVQKRSLFEKETALRSALTAVAKEEDKCFASFEAEAVQDLKSACEASQKIEDDVSALA